MKIGILTWSKSVNHGALLQAYASQEMLKSLEFVPVMLNYNRAIEHMDKKFVRRIRLFFLRFNRYYLKTRKILPEWNKQKKLTFDEFIKKEIRWGDYYNVDQGLACVMIGSDMIFDFYEGYNAFSYGKEVKAPYCFSYAASFGRTTEKLFEKSPHKNEIIQLLHDLKGIGFRDDNTQNILSTQCKISDAVKTIDPVLLYGFSKEKERWNSGKWENRKYILIYSYSFNMDKRKEVLQILSFAEKNHLEVISVGYPHLWCNQCVNAGPKEFLEMFVNARYVITDTFHGVVFSLITNKQFCVTIRDNSFKVCDVLKEVGLDGLWRGELSGKLNRLLLNSIDYNLVNDRISKLRNESISFLYQHILTCGDEIEK